MPACDTRPVLRVMAYLAIHRAPWGRSGHLLLLDGFEGRIGCSWRETDVDSTDRETLIRDLLDGQYSRPVRVVALRPMPDDAIKTVRRGADKEDRATP